MRDGAGTSHSEQRAGRRLAIVGGRGAVGRRGAWRRARLGMRKPRPCAICRKWFLPDARVKDRQHACSAAACQSERRRRTQAAWREAHAGYFIAYRIEQRAAHEGGRSSSTTAAPTTGRDPPASTPTPTRDEPPMSPRMPPPLDRLPWDLAQDQFGSQGAGFLAVFGRVLVESVKAQSGPRKT
jgi:hypothetical protein